MFPIIAHAFPVNFLLKVLEALLTAANVSFLCCVWFLLSVVSGKHFNNARVLEKFLHSVNVFTAQWSLWNEQSPQRGRTVNSELFRKWLPGLKEIYSQGILCFFLCLFGHVNCLFRSWKTTWIDASTIVTHQSWLREEEFQSPRWQGCLGINPPWILHLSGELPFTIQAQRWPQLQSNVRQRCPLQTASTQCRLRQKHEKPESANDNFPVYQTSNFSISNCSG